MEISPEKAGRIAQATATSVVVAGLLWLGVVSGLDAENPGAAISLLLAGAALYSGIAAVQGEHKLVRTLFANTRSSLAVVTFSALVASASLAMEFPRQHPVWVWRLAAIATSLAAGRLAWSLLRAPKEGQTRPVSTDR